MIRTFATLMLLYLVCFKAIAAMTLDELQQRSAKNPVIRAEFEQTKQISGMSQPLTSSGNVIIAQSQGLWWQQNQPFPLTLLLTEQRMVQTAPGQAVQVITAETNPQLFQFNSLLMDLFRADRAQLEKNFRLILQTEAPNKWIVTLTPKTMPFNKLFHSITITGADLLETIVIDDKQNDKTSIRFFHHQTQPNHLTDEERRRFAS